MIIEEQSSLTTSVGTAEADSTVSVDSSATEEIQRRGKGRPTKKEIAAKKPGGRKRVGRPPGEAAIMNDYRARMLASPKSDLVIAKVFDTALQDEHPHQAACMKMIMDRVLPVKGFEPEKGTRITKVEIEVTTDGKKSDADAVEGEFVEVESGETNDDT